MRLPSPIAWLSLVYVGSLIIFAFSHTFLHTTTCKPKQLSSHAELLAESTRSPEPSIVVVLKTELAPGEQVSAKSVLRDGVVLGKSVSLSSYQDSCVKDFGFPLIERWQKAGKTYCGAQGVVSKSDLWSEVRCHRILQTGHGGHDNICEVRNLVIKYAMLGQGVTGGSEDSEYFTFTDALGARCQKDSELFDLNNFQLENKPIFSALRASPQEDVSGTCSEWVEEPTLFVTRQDYANMYHATADFMNAYLTLHVFGLESLISKDGPGIRVVILDAHAKTPIEDVWRTVFTKTRPFEFAGALREARKETCYRRAVFSLPNGSCMFYKDWGSTNRCGGAGGYDLFKGYANTVLAAYDLLHEPVPTQPVVTFLWRRDYVAHPRDHGKRMDKVRNEEELLQKISSSDGVLVSGVDLSSMTVREQLQTIRRSNIVVSMHGAGLTHLMYLPDEAVVVEMFPHGVSNGPTGRKQHYRNLSRWCGKVYLAWRNTIEENHDRWSTLVDWNSFGPVMDAAIRIARMFHLGADMGGL
mmetsp:Transcript_2431/g.4282  ORF Transcript_2431/g.4282 Transcript_2431/m.4282 type:complete len:526 (+) Transcript_2431:116-1693(+)